MYSHELECVRTYADTVLDFAPAPVKAMGCFVLDAVGIGVNLLPRQLEQQQADQDDFENRQIKDVLNKYPSY